MQKIKVGRQVKGLCGNDHNQLHHGVGQYVVSNIKVLYLLGLIKNMNNIHVGIVMHMPVTFMLTIHIAKQSIMKKKKEKYKHMMEP